MNVTIFNTEVYVDNGTTMAIISALVGDEYREFTGSARRHPDDRSNPEVGRQMAVARAYKSLSATLERRAKGLMKHNDDVQAMRAAAKAREAKIVAKTLEVTGVTAKKAAPARRTAKKAAAPRAMAAST